MAGIRMPFVAAIAPGRCICYGWDFDGEQSGCICPDEERALRFIISGTAPAMTSEQREECLQEIGSVEGYRRSDYETESDQGLARGVLDAWMDFCRDKGLL